jgi:hypothetical protein
LGLPYFHPFFLVLFFSIKKQHSRAEGWFFPMTYGSLESSPSHEGQQVLTHDLEGHALVAAVGAGVPEVVRHLPAGHWNIWNMGK